MPGPNIPPNIPPDNTPPASNTASILESLRQKKALDDTKKAKRDLDIARSKLERAKVSKNEISKKSGLGKTSTVDLANISKANTAVVEAARNVDILTKAFEGYRKTLGTVVKDTGGLGFDKTSQDIKLFNMSLEKTQKKLSLTRSAIDLYSKADKATGSTGFGGWGGIVTDAADQAVESVKRAGSETAASAGKTYSQIARRRKTYFLESFVYGSALTNSVKATTEAMGDQKSVTESMVDSLNVFGTKLSNLVTGQHAVADTSGSIADGLTGIGETAATTTVKLALLKPKFYGTVQMMKAGGMAIKEIFKKTKELIPTLTAAGLALKAVSDISESGESALKNFYRAGVEPAPKMAKTLGELSKRMGTNIKLNELAARAAVDLGMEYDQVREYAQKLQYELNNTDPALSSAEAMAKLTKQTILAARALEMDAGEAIQFVTTRTNKFGESSEEAVGQLKGIVDQIRKTNDSALKAGFTRGDLFPEDLSKLIIQASNETGAYGQNLELLTHISTKTFQTAKKAGMTYNESVEGTQAVMKALTSTENEFLRQDVGTKLYKKLIAGGDAYIEQLGDIAPEQKKRLREIVEDVKNGKSATYDVQQSIYSYLSQTTEGVKLQLADMQKFGDSGIGGKMLENLYGVSASGSKTLQMMSRGGMLKGLISDFESLRGKNKGMLSETEAQMMRWPKTWAGTFAGYLSSMGMDLEKGLVGSPIMQYLQRGEEITNNIKESIIGTFKNPAITATIGLLMAAGTVLAPLLAGKLVKSVTGVDITGHIKKGVVGGFEKSKEIYSKVKNEGLKKTLSDGVQWAGKKNREVYGKLAKTGPFKAIIGVGNTVGDAISSAMRTAGSFVAKQFYNAIHGKGITGAREKLGKFGEKAKNVGKQGVEKVRSGLGLSERGKYDKGGRRATPEEREMLRRTGLPGFNHPGLSGEDISGRGGRNSSRRSSLSNLADKSKKFGRRGLDSVNKFGRGAEGFGKRGLGAVGKFGKGLGGLASSGLSAAVLGGSMLLGGGLDMGEMENINPVDEIIGGLQGGEGDAKEHEKAEKKEEAKKRRVEKKEALKASLSRGKESVKGSLKGASEELKRISGRGADLVLGGRVNVDEMVDSPRKQRIIELRQKQEEKKALKEAQLVADREKKQAEAVKKKEANIEAKKAREVKKAERKAALQRYKQKLLPDGGIKPSKLGFMGKIFGGKKSAIPSKGLSSIAMKGLKFGAKGLGTAAMMIPLASLSSTAEAIQTGEKDKLIKSLGGMAGGIAMGAAIGSVVPVVGTMIGGTIGAFAGEALTEKIMEFAKEGSKTPDEKLVASIRQKVKEAIASENIDLGKSITETISKNVNLEKDKKWYTKFMEVIVATAGASADDFSSIGKGSIEDMKNEKKLKEQMGESVDIGKNIIEEVKLRVSEKESEIEKGSAKVIELKKKISEEKYGFMKDEYEKQLASEEVTLKNNQESLKGLKVKSADYAKTFGNKEYEKAQADYINATTIIRDIEEKALEKKNIAETKKKEFLDKMAEAQKIEDERQRKLAVDKLMIEDARYVEQADLESREINGIYETAKKTKEESELILQAQVGRDAVNRLNAQYMETKDKAVKAREAYNKKWNASVNIENEVEKEAVQAKLKEEEAEIIRLEDTAKGFKDAAVAKTKEQNTTLAKLQYKGADAETLKKLGVTPEKKKGGGKKVKTQGYLSMKDIIAGRTPEEVIAGAKKQPPVGTVGVSGLENKPVAKTDTSLLQETKDRTFQSLPDDLKRDERFLATLTANTNALIANKEDILPTLEDKDKADSKKIATEWAKNAATSTLMSKEDQDAAKDVILRKEREERPGSLIAKREEAKEKNNILKEIGADVKNVNTADDSAMIKFTNVSLMLAAFGKKTAEIAPSLTA